MKELHTRHNKKRKKKQKNITALNNSKTIRYKFGDMTISQKIFGALLIS